MVDRDIHGKFLKKSKPWNTGLTFSGMSGKHHSAETKKKMRIARKKQVITEETKKKLRLINLGKKQSKQTIEKRRKKLIGKKRTVKQRKVMSKNSWNKGKHGIYSINTLKQMSEYGKKHPISYWKGKHRSLETKNKLSKSIKKLWKNPEYLKKQQSVTIKCKNNKLERSVQNELKKRKIQFTTHKSIMGRPDIFIEPNLCIFCDGDFWYGNPDKYKATDLIGKGTSRGPAKNKWKKDKKITLDLINNNYIVLRFWEKDILNDIQSIVDKIQYIGGDINGCT